MIEIILIAAGLYLALGLVSTAVVHVTGLRRIDAAVNGAGWLFRLLITPGLIALWPVLLSKQWRAAQGEDPAGRADRPISPRGLRGAHRILATCLLVLLPLAVAMGLLARPEPPPGNAVVAPRRALPERLPQVLMEASVSVGAAEGTWRLLGDKSGRAQVELRLDRDVALPSLALYWAPADGPGLPAGAVFLGSVWGPGLFRFPVEEQKGGVFIVYSLAHRERVVTIDGRKS